MRFLWLAVFLSAAACADYRYFAPRENRNGSGPEGYPAAVYPLRDGDAHGEVRLWSAGTREVELEERDAVELHVGFELENTGQAPLELAAIGCTGPDLGGQGHDEAPLVDLRGEARAAPGGTTRVDAVFRPAVEGARDVSQFRVRFTVLAGDRQVLVQTTPFAPWAPRDPWVDDPWFYGPRFGFGFGWWGHRCR